MLLFLRHTKCLFLTLVVNFNRKNPWNRKHCPILFLRKQKRLQSTCICYPVIFKLTCAVLHLFTVFKIYINFNN